MTDYNTNKLEKQEILVVDDTPASLQLLTGILTGNGYSVRPASSGRLALRSVAARLPDLILLDIKMLDMDGYEVCRRLKNDRHSSKIPVIFLSALGETTEKIKGFNAGGVDYITKPFESEEVLARVRIHLQLRELTEKLEQKVLERTLDLEKSNQNLRQEVIERKRVEEALKESEKELRHLNEELESRVKIRTSELENANKELIKTVVELKQTQAQLVESEKMAALGSLVAGVAHEINTPVGVGVTAASHLYDKVKNYQKMYESNSLKRKDFEELLFITSQSSSLVLSNLNRAIELISSFKQVAVDQSSGEQRRFNIEKYIQEILLSLHYKLKNKNHQIKVNCPENIEINSYPSAFYQIFTNLIFNSLTHGFDEDDNGIISIDIKLKNSRVYIAFNDNGKGIACENLKRIFEPFYTTRRNIGGSGLGLHIVYNLVTQTLKGKIRCESKPDSGTVFFIDFPVNGE